MRADLTYQIKRFYKGNMVKITGTRITKKFQITGRNTRKTGYHLLAFEDNLDPDNGRALFGGNMRNTGCLKKSGPF